MIVAVVTAVEVAVLGFSYAENYGGWPASVVGFPSPPNPRAMVPRPIRTILPRELLPAALATLARVLERLGLVFFVEALVDAHRRVNPPSVLKPRAATWIAAGLAADL